MRNPFIPLFIRCFVAAAAVGLISAAEKPNILFFLVDDLGHRDLGCYGSPFYETPNIDRLAADGMLFTDAYAASQVCSPTRASILTGRYPQRTGITDYIDPNGGNLPDKWNRNTALLPAVNRDHLALEEVTLAEVLGDAGYATMFAGKWHLGGEGFYPEDQGFDINRGGHASGAPWAGNQYFSPYKNPRLSDGPEGEHLPDRLASEVSSFIKENREQPFFAYFSFYSVHTPLMTRDDLRRKYEDKRKSLGFEDQWGRETHSDLRLNQAHAVYAGMVEAMDAAVGKVLDTLETEGLAENTIIILTSDNGGNSTSEGSPTSNLPWRGGKGWAYEGGIRVPLIVRWPGVTRPGTTTAAMISSQDFFPTLVKAAGAEMPDAIIDGVDFRPILQHQAARDRSLFWHYPHYSPQGGAPNSTVRQGDWKLIQSLEDQRLELYNLVLDPGEQRNLANSDPERADKMLKDLKAWREKIGATFPTPNPKYDPARPTSRATRRRP